MKALVLKQYKQFALEDVPAPQPGPAEVLVAVKACGICGSDVHGMDGSTGRRRPPVIMGHEAAGVIASIGSGVAGWVAGDRVTFDSTIYCGQCVFCRRGLINLCDNRRVLGGFLRGISAGRRFCRVRRGAATYSLPAAGQALLRARRAGGAFRYRVARDSPRAAGPE